jgi:hypothetical protein
MFLTGNPKFAAIGPISRARQVKLTLEINSLTWRLNHRRNAKAHSKCSDAGDQFIDTASQSLAQSRFALET